MYKFSKKSAKNLEEAHIDLQMLFLEVIKHKDCSIVEGRRTKEEQNYLVKLGKSHLKWPHSKHNCEDGQQSMAVDVWPYPRPSWEDTTAWREFAIFVKGVASGMGIEVTSGGLDWVKFKDYPHWQLEREN